MSGWGGEGWVGGGRSRGKGLGGGGTGAAIITITQTTICAHADPGTPLLMPLPPPLGFFRIIQYQRGAVTERYLWYL